MVFLGFYHPRHAVVPDGLLSTVRSTRRPKPGCTPSVLLSVLVPEGYNNKSGSRASLHALGLAFLGARNILASPVIPVRATQLQAGAPLPEIALMTCEGTIGGGSFIDTIQ